MRYKKSDKKLGLKNQLKNMKSKKKYKKIGQKNI